MLTLEIAGKETWDEKQNMFMQSPSFTLQLEHSLISLSKWESIWKKPFLSQEGLTEEEFLSYIQCMTITQNVSPEKYAYLSPQDRKKIREYIDNPMTATWFSEDKNRNGRRGNTRGETLTSEYIYYLMISQNIPLACEKWHLNRLMTLIRVCAVKNGGNGKKMSEADTLKQYAQLNAARRMKKPHV